MGLSYCSVTCLIPPFHVNISPAFACTSKVVSMHFSKFGTDKFHINQGIYRICKYILFLKTSRSELRMLPLLKLSKVVCIRTLHDRSTTTKRKSFHVDHIMYNWLPLQKKIENRINLVLQQQVLSLLTYLSPSFSPQ